MRIKDIPIIAIGVILLALATYHIIERNDITIGVIIALAGLYTLTYMIMFIAREKRLESELQLKIDNISIVKQDRVRIINELAEVEKERDNWKEKFKQFSNAYDEPFAEDTQPETQGYVCPECGKPMTRMTTNIAFCDNIECKRKQWKRDKLDKGEY